MNYVTSDIHGKYELFIRLLELIKFNKSDTLYILGDVIDRGEEPIKLLDFIMKQPNIKMTMGNHEEMMVDYLERFERSWFYRCWMNTGGHITLGHFLHKSEEEQIKIYNYLKSLPVYYKYKNYILTHAGIDCDYSLDDQPEDVLWLDKFDDDIKSFSLSDTIVYGHTPTKWINKDKSYDINFNKNKIAIDGGSCFGGQLNCLNLDTLETYKVL